MMPALFSGVSGLKNHQFRMNVIANNLANVNTVGFKYSRVSFSDLVYQTVRDASAPQSVGGANPVQMGLGSLVNSVDVINTQGNLESTGQSTDMSIQGDGYFVLNDGSQNKYTRAGLMVLSLDGSMTNPSDGLSYMGWNAVNGVVDTSGPVESIRIPLGTVLPAQSTSEMVLTGNLNAAGTVSVGTITSTGSLLATANTTTLATDLHNSTGVSLGIASGTQLNITGSVGGTTIVGQSITITPTSTLQDIATAIQTALRSVADGALTETATVQADGSIRVATDGANDITNLHLSVAGNMVLNNALQYDTTILAGTTGDSNTFRSPATATDTLVSLFDANGNPLALQVGDDITMLSSTSSGTILTDIPILSDITNASTYGQYRDGLRTALFSSAPATGEDVTIAADGSLVVTGSVGADNAVTGIIVGAGVNPGDDSRSVFSSAQSFAQDQAAADATYSSFSSIAYDSLGNAQSIDYTFTKTADNTWNWSASNGGNNVGSGVFSFTPSGILTTPTGNLSIPVSNGAATPLAITVDFSAVTQFSDDSILTLGSQNGFESSTLEGFSTGQSGEVVGTFSNGQNVTLGQLAIATFQNPTGLLREGRSLLVESPNSGLANLGVAGTGGRGAIVSGTLEMSNVDVAREFTDMIVTQRGFQANSRVITTSDSLLEELVNLKR
jgi:flagellar hook protein FlgE